MGTDSIYNCYYFICFLCEFWKEILAGLFSGLAIFAYFYKDILIYRNIIILKGIKKDYEKIKLVDMSPRDNELNNMFNLMKENVTVQLEAISRGLYAKLDAEFFVINQKFDKIDSIDKRLKTVEDSTKFITDSKQYKWVLAFAFFGLISVFNFESIKLWVAKFLPW